MPSWLTDHFLKLKMVG